MENLVIATHNQGKLKEIRTLLADFPYQITSLADHDLPAPEEPGQSFVENALIKARFGALHCKTPCLADDSGLVVDALSGKPGIHSARFAGNQAGDRDNIDALLNALRGIPEQQRTARYICILCYLRYPEDPDPIICRGVWQGIIVDEMSGENGFGYDPIFYLPKQHCTVAQLDMETKNFASHRGQALRQFLQLLGS